MSSCERFFPVLLVYPGCPGKETIKWVSSHFGGLGPAWISLGKESQLIKT